MAKSNGDFLVKSAGEYLWRSIKSFDVIEFFTILIILAQKSLIILRANINLFDVFFYHFSLLFYNKFVGISFTINHAIIYHIMYFYSRDYGMLNFSKSPLLNLTFSQWLNLTTLPVTLHRIRNSFQAFLCEGRSDSLLVKPVLNRFFISVTVLFTITFCTESSYGLTPALINKAELLQKTRKFGRKLYLLNVGRRN